MRIVDERFYNGSEEKIKRLGISVYAETKDLLAGIPLALHEERDSNSGAAVRELIDAAFEGAGGWKKAQTGDIDWRKCSKINGTHICVGVEVQVSARSDLVVIDVMHLRTAIEKGDIDLGVLVVPSDRMAVFLTDRAPSFRETVIAIEDRMRADTLPLVVLSVEHDAPGIALPKRIKKAKKRTETR